ncbi:MAG TPA: Fe-S cluster assembly protein SufD [Chthoniobacterales bacterium]|jgi:Fe-S cluster assembly protein SufD
MRTLDDTLTATSGNMASLLDTPFIDPTAPEWLQNLRQQAWIDFQNTPAPTRRDEAWRFANLKMLQLDQYQPASKMSRESEENIVERSLGLTSIAGRLVFANGLLLAKQEISEELASKGVQFLTFDEAVTTIPALIQQHFMTQKVGLGSARLAALHKAKVSTGTVIHVPKNVEVALPLEIFHWLDGENSTVFPHTLIILGDNAKLTVLEHYQSTLPHAEGLACAVNDLILGAGAKLTYVSVQNWSDTARSFQINSTELGRDAHATNMVVNIGSAYARYESASHMRAPGGHSDMLAVNVAADHQEYDQRTFQNHAQPNCTSDLLYKNALSDFSRTIFAGLIKVEEHSHKTDAYQKVRNLLLSDDSEANSMPGLEILADDVRCSHGATSGQLEQDEIFYLLSRGISEKEARKLLVAGFLNEAIARLGNEEIEARINALIAQKSSVTR